jgi:hypothetical protein
MNNPKRVAPEEVKTATLQVKPQFVVDVKKHGFVSTTKLPAKENVLQFLGTLQLDRCKVVIDFREVPA